MSLCAGARAHVAAAPQTLLPRRALAPRGRRAAASSGGESPPEGAARASPPRPPRRPPARPPPAHRPAAAAATAAAADADAAPSGADDAAARFSAELSRRRIASIDDIKDRPAPPPGFARDAELSSGQLERSQRLNAEGLEGLIPRGTELLKLGLSFFLAFGPFILGVALATAIVWSVFGEAFIHVSSAAPLVGQSRQKTSRKPTNLRTTH
jgi:hypothetical protein